MDQDVPPTDLCLRLRPYLQATAWLYLVVGILRARKDPWDFVVYGFMAWIGLGATLKALRMHTVFFYMVVSAISTLSDFLWVSHSPKSWSELHTILVSWRSVCSIPGSDCSQAVAEAAFVLGFLAAPLVGLLALVVSYWMTSDYSLAIDARADEERRALLAAVSGVGGYQTIPGIQGFQAFSGRGRRLEE